MCSLSLSVAQSGRESFNLCLEGASTTFGKYIAARSGELVMSIR